MRHACKCRVIVIHTIMSADDVSRADADCFQAGDIDDDDMDDDDALSDWNLRTYD